MAWKKATASDYKDLILQIRNFCIKTMDTGTTTIGGSNVGDGIIYGTSATESSVAETWTVTCTSGGSIEITGNPTPDITGTYAQSGTNDGKPYYDDGTNAVWWHSTNGYWYVTLIASIGTPPSDGFRLSNDQPVGTWEAFGTATGVPVSAGTADPTFSVTGSVSGAKAAATMLVPYSNGLLSMTILDGTVPYASGDTFDIPIASSTAEWAEERYDATTDPDSPELILNGIGGGTDEIYIGIQGITNSSTYWNLDLQGFTGYVAANTFEAQPGYSTNHTAICAANTSFDFWIFMSSRSVRVVCTVGTVVEHAYLGWILPNQTPSQYDYPLFRGGTSGLTYTVASDVTSSHIAWWNSEASDNEGRFLEDSTWSALNIDDLYPHYYAYFNLRGPDYLGNYPPFPVTIGNFSVDKVYGDVEGIYYIPTQGGTPQNDDIISSTTTAYYVFQDTFRSGEERAVAYDLL